MKIPSLIKIPKHQRFHIEPRYYDPVKEEIEQKTSRIKKELELEKNSTEDDQNNVRTRMAGTFSSRIAKREKNGSAGLIQFILIVILFISFFGYIYFGNVALYFLGLVILLFVYMKIRKIF